MATDLNRIELGAGQVAAVDCRRCLGTFGWIGETESAAMTVEFSNDARPAATDWFAHNEVGTVAADQHAASLEDGPVGWLRFSAATGGSATVRLAFVGDVSVHHSGDDPLADGTPIEAANLAPGATVERYLAGAFAAYEGPFGSLNYSVASDRTDVATVALTRSGDVARITGVAAGTATITITATAPHGGTARATIAVTVA